VVAAGAEVFFAAGFVAAAGAAFAAAGGLAADGLVAAAAANVVVLVAAVFLAAGFFLVVLVVVSSAMIYPFFPSLSVCQYGWCTERALGRLRRPARTPGRIEKSALPVKANDYLPGVVTACVANQPAPRIWSRRRESARAANLVQASRISPRRESAPPDPR
jgi:hypothetical protein